MPEHDQNGSEPTRAARPAGPLAFCLLGPLLLALCLAALAGCERVPVLNDPPLVNPAGPAGPHRQPTVAVADPAPPPPPAAIVSPTPGPTPPQASSMSAAPSRGGPIAPAGEVRLEKITLSDALLAPQRFAGGMSVFAERDEHGQVRATLGAFGQTRQVAVPGQADFYALSNRPDLVVMHDRTHDYADTIRIFQFSPTKVTERVCGHEPRAAGYLVQLYRNFELVGAARTIAVTEELSSGSAKPMVRERFALPVD